MSDERVREGYPEIQDNPDDTEGDEGNPGVPGEYLDQVIKDDEVAAEDELRKAAWK